MSPRRLIEPLRTRSRTALFTVGLLAIVAGFYFSSRVRNPALAPKTPESAKRNELRASAPDSHRPTGTVDAATRLRVEDNYNNVPMHFEENEGQVDGEVRYLSRGRGYTLFLTPTEAVLSLKKSKPRPLASAFESSSDRNQHLTAQRRLSDTTTAAEMMRMRIVGGNPTAKITGHEELPGKVNYFIGQDSGKWRTNVSTFKRVRYEAVYPGIDLVYYGNQLQLEYDFILSPQTNPGVLRLQFDGVTNLRIAESGALVLTTKSGDEIHQHQPVTYQEIEGQRREVYCKYVLHSSSIVGFEVENYDKSKPLVIDPTLVYSTYHGGSVGDLAHAIAVDSSGNAYVTGYTSSSNFPIVNPRQSFFGGEPTDVFVTKINAAGTALIYSTYLGGSSGEAGTSIAVNSSGNASVTGYTDSFEFPVFAAFQSFKSTGRDAFVLKLGVNGNTLDYSTYLGGNSSDSGAGIAVDSSGVYVVGNTFSTNFKIANPRQSTSGGGSDGFFSKFNNDGTLAHSSYLGGNGDDLATGVAIGDPAEPYLTGYTSSTNFPTANARQPSLAGNRDAFLTKLNTGGGLIYSTYHGGSGDDFANGIAVDATASRAIIIGYTGSTNFPTANAIQPNSGGGNDAFVSRFNETASALVYSTYLGGSSFDLGRGVAADRSGNVWIGGVTGSSNFPTLNALQSILADNGEIFVTKLNSTGAIVYSTMLGGTETDALFGIASNTNGTYIVGQTTGKFLITPGARQDTYGGGIDDAFITRISEASNPTYYAIRGHLQYSNGSPIEGAVMQLDGSISKTTTTNSNGNYIFQMLSPGNYVVTPPLVLNTTPSQRTYTPLAANDPNANFVSNQVVQISGRVRNANGRGLSGIRVDVSGSSGLTTQTDANGSYAFSVPAGGSYTVGPNDSRVGNWLPTNTIPHNNLIQDAPGNDFTANLPSFTVSGAVKNSSGTVFPNLPNVLRLSGGGIIGSVQYSTNNLGRYTSDQLNTLADYVFTPQPFTANGITYNVFSPAVANFVSLPPCGSAGAPPGVPCCDPANPPPGAAFCSGADYLSVDFTAIPAPVATTSAATGVTPTAATLNGGANPRGVMTNAFFEWGTDAALNTNSSTPAQNVGSGTINQAVSANLTGLSGGVTYYFRAVASSNGGTVRGSILNFTTLPTPRTLTVASSNPNSGVSITVSPNDNNAAGNGTTQFARTYNNNQVVSLTAPTTASGNNFQKWLKDEADFANNSNANVSVTMDADHTMRAVYVTPTRTLTVASLNPASGVSITVSPNDNNAAGNGTTQFTRTYNNNQVVSLTAPATASGNTFQKWLKDGADFANNSNANVSVTMDADHTMRAVYVTPTRTLTVSSLNPASGVSITVSPNDNNAAGNGTTQFTRTYNNNQVVSLTAPTTASGNNFQKWLKDNADFANNTLTNVSVTMDADHGMTAVYVTPTPPGPTIFVEDGTSQLAAVDSITFIRGPFTLTNPKNFSSDQRTRIIFFTTNLGLPQTSQPPTSTLSVQVNGNTHAVESVGPNTVIGGSLIVFRLPDLAPGTYPLGIRLGSVDSTNTPTLTIIAPPSSSAAAFQPYKANPVEYLLFPLIDLIL